MRRVVLAALAVALAMPAPTAAAKKMPAPRPDAVTRPAPPPPALLVRRGDRSVPLKLTRVDVDTRIVGHLAETRMTMTFYNGNSRVLEGDLVFPLPEGATVSHYALDVNGNLVDGVVVEKERARRIFETEVRKGVDPGLAEWVGGNHFKTRIFPIPAKGSRTIRVGYVSEVLTTRDGPQFLLPLDFRDPVGELSLRVEVVKAEVAPAIVRGGPRGLKFGAFRDSFVAESKLKNAPLTADLALALPKLDAQPVRVETAPSGETTFAIRDAAVPPAGPSQALAPRRLGLYWDASMSRAQSDTGREIDLLRRYLEGLGRGPIAVELVVFRNAAEPPQRFSIPADLPKLVATLEGVVYDGGTQLGAATPPRGAAKADLNLLFTDGVSNFGAAVPAGLTAPTWVVASGRTVNRPLMRYLAMKTGGAYVHLARSDVADALAVLGRPVYSFLGVDARGVVKGSVHPNLPVPVQGTFALAGQLAGDEATVTLKYGIGDRVLHTREVKVRRSDAAQGDLLQRWWAGRRVDDLLVFPEDNADEIVATGKRYGIVTPGTSLLVLERFEQYLEHGVRPPASLPDMRKRYDEEVERRDLAAKRERQSKLEQVLKMWEERVAWWSKTYEYPPNFRYGAASDKKMAEAPTARPAPMRAPATGAPPPSPQADEEVAAEPAPGAKEKKKDGGGDRAPEPGVVIKPWDPDTPYLKVLKQAPKAKRYEAYLGQREEHGAAPAFYLDVAHWLRREGEPALALRVLSNLAELELENAALVRVLAHRLAQVGELDLAAQLFEVALRLRPEEPQSYRDLALVLARRADEPGSKASKAARKADYERAMQLLAEVVMGRWDRFAEIEVIALTELNNILPRAKQVGVSKPPVDPRLVKHLDLDVRIVMTWDADATDMDLHVVEPSGEEAYYGHNRTTIGGLVSRDFTRGYGPEVYAVRRAMKGRYVIRTKYFGSSAAKLAGGVTLQVDVFTNYGRPSQKRRSLTLRLTEKKEAFTVGEIEF